jgi:DNA-directed RNA polymerase specialized sigma24 family protein
MAIARYCAIDYMRRERLALDADEVPPETFTRGGEADARPNHPLDDVDGLPPETRLCLDLAYADGYSFDEIAHLTLIPLTVVKQTIRACMMRLRDKTSSGEQAA